MPEGIELKYVTFSSDGLYDFKSVILPNVYEELFLLDRFDTRGISAIGALADGEPAAALIAQFTGEADAVIHSIFVSEELRRQGIGTELFRRFLSIANMKLDPMSGKGNNAVPLDVTADYTLPSGMASVFKSFLSSLNFRLFDDQPDVCYFESNDLKEFGKTEDGVFCFADIDGTDESEILGYFDAFGASPAVRYSFYSGSKDDPSAMLLVCSGDNDTYVFSSVKLTDTVDEKEYEKLVSSAVDAIRREHGSFAVIADGRTNVFPECWSRLAGKYGETVKHCIAGLIAIFE